MNKSKQNVVRCLSIDPAIGDLGWTVMVMDLDTLKVVVEYMGMFSSSAVAKKVAYKDDVTKYGPRMIALELLRAFISNLIDKYHPEFVASEAAYLDPRKVNAFISLTQVLLAIRLLLFHNYQRTLHLVATKTAKHAITGYGASSKTDIQTTIFTHEDISFKNPEEAKTMTKHVSDAIAVGYSFFRDTYPNLNIQTAFAA